MVEDTTKYIIELENGNVEIIASLTLGDLLLATLIVLLLSFFAIKFIFELIWKGDTDE